jgi:hypothetical protein
LGEGEHALDGIETTFVLRRLGCAQAEHRRVVSAAKQRWLAVTETSRPTELTPRFHSPSQAAAGPVSGSPRSEELPGPSYFPAGSDEIRYNLIGDAVHAYLAALPSLRSLDDQAKETVAARCLSAFSVSGLIAASAIVTAGNRFAEWVNTRYPGARWSTEMTAAGPRRAGGRWHGTVDLVLASGSVVIVDHKSAPIRRDQCQAKAAQFTGQLAAYREVLASDATPVAGTWIHFPLAGVMVEFQ